MKKTLAFILTLVMLLSCLSITAFATTDPSWSYDEATDTITINYEIPAGAEVGANVPNPDFLSGDGDNITNIAFGWGVQDDDAPFIYNGVHWNALNGTFASGNRYGYVIMITYKDTTVDHSNATVILNGKTYTNLGNGFEGEINYQPILIVDFGVLGADGKFTGGDFAETESGNKSGTTDITAIKAAPLSYKLVIPQNVPTITKAGVTEIGAPSIKDVTGATEKTVISYTASGTNFKLSTDESKTMTATYYSAYTDASTNTVLDSTKAIEVYKSGAVIASPTSLYVGVAEDAWNAADAGTYHATVTFNFEAEEKEPGCEVTASLGTMRVIKLDETDVFSVEYFEGDDPGAVTFINIYTKTEFETRYGVTDYSVGDCFHMIYDEQSPSYFSYKKCTSPESHGFDPNPNGAFFTAIFSSTGQGNPMTYFAPVTTYTITDGKLYIGGEHFKNMTCSSWKLNGAQLPDGATGTIEDGDAFVGITG